MSPPSDDFQTPPRDPVDDVPTVTCSRCNREWDLTYELDELKLGNQSVEQFALDHHRHTGHFPDDVTPWVASCRQCPDGEQFLSESPARRWARTHTRHTTHEVSLEHAGESTVLDAE
ncbi:hypothetical protein C453_18985 [Haloferax elongans ATCC BAA-1513]|uniref:Uncharacterized protein n=1 Tax=Haloferax elongans ATCC BAA-1513 TaxID=1230453 RepID=M0HBI4_HALEO|nr:hypothetical protein [Haloferax elongans]ELZ81052.1 hypothetical protein C453_18985 [Haloferax elongans ATCC BAA-1513]